MDGVQFLALLTLISNIGIIIFLVLFFLRYTKSYKNIWTKFSLFSKHILLFAWIVSLTATLGSLYLSEVRGFVPCVLCWYQRIFMYPLSVIFGVGYFRKSRDIVFYVLPLVIIGGLIAAYHYLLQVNPNQFAPCTAVGFSASCSDRFTVSYGYITIPWMALSAFVLIGFSMVLLITQKPKKLR